MNVYVLVWEFQVKDGVESEFEKQYGNNGDWCKLFSKSPAFLKSELIKDCSKPKRYLTLDYWHSKADYDEFRHAQALEYESIDARCETLTTDEQNLGSFFSLDSAE